MSEKSKEFIGYCYYENRGYFLLKDYVKTFNADMIFTLNKIIEYISSVVADGMDAFSAIEKIENADGTVTVNYKRGFNITQCRYFIAYMVVSKIGNAPVLTKPDRNIPQTYKDQILEILKVNIDPKNSQVFPADTHHPFLIKTVDFTVPHAFDETMPYLIKDKKEDDAVVDGEDSRVFLTRHSTNIAALVGEKSDVIIDERGEKRNIPEKETILKRTLTASTVPFSGTQATGAIENAIQVELKEDNLNAGRISPNSKQFFKLAVFQHYESNLDSFINGNKDSVTEIIFKNCSSLYSKKVENITKEIAFKFIKKIKESDLGRGLLIISNKSRKKYKKNTIKKSRRKGSKIRKTRRKN